MEDSHFLRSLTIGLPLYTVKLGMEHFSCFPDTGKIKVHGLTVKKKSFFYRLSDSMAIKHVFKELTGTWLLHLDLSSMQNAPEDRSLAPFTSKLAFPDSSPHGDNQSQKSVSLNVADNNAKSDHSEEQAEIPVLSPYSRKNLKKADIIEHDNTVEANKWRRNREAKSAFAPSFNAEHQPDTVSEGSIEGKEHKSLSILENSSSSQAISVTGIISRFFSELDEVDSCYCQPKHVHETVHVCIDELRDSKIRILTSQPNHTNNRKTILSDTDTQCSFAKQQKETTVVRTNAALKVKKQQIGSRKHLNKKSSLCTSHISSRMYIETSRGKSCKYQVGKRLIQAANGIQISRNGKRSATKFLSKFKKLTSSDSASFVRTAFNVDDFAD